MAAFSSLLDILAEVPDPRRAEGKLYKLPHVLLFSILAIISGYICIAASSPSSTSIASG